jgi:hypothetical protein
MTDEEILEAYDKIGGPPLTLWQTWFFLQVLKGGPIGRPCYRRYQGA